MSFRFVKEEHLRNCIKELTNDEKNRLYSSIEQNGCIKPVIVWENTIIDGYTRVEYCIKNNIDFKIEFLHFDNEKQALGYRVIKNIIERGMSEVERAETIVDNLDDVKVYLASRNDLNGAFRDKMRQLCKVTYKLFCCVKKIKKKNRLDLLNDLKNGQSVASIMNTLENGEECAIKNNEYKTCKACGKVKRTEDFYKKRGICKKCFNSRYRQQSVIDTVVNNKIDLTISNEAMQQIETSLYNTSQDIQYTKEDFIEEINELQKSFINNLNNTVMEHIELFDKNIAKDLIKKLDKELELIQRSAL